MNWFFIYGLNYNDPVIVLLIVLIVANLFWLAILAQAITGIKRLVYLKEDDEPTSTPKVSILVPARNESRILSQTLSSLLQIDYPDFEVIVIDDHSDDNTFEIASSFAIRDSRISVIRSAELPADWFGKNWALHQAAFAARGVWLLLTDADVNHRAALLKKAVAMAQHQKLDFLSVLPLMECETFWEKVILPAFAIVLTMIRPIHKSNDPRSPIALASGGFILVKALVFKYLGGFGPVRDAIADDIALAELFKASGCRVMTVLTKTKFLSTRMYCSLKGIWEGLSRHAFELRHYSPLRILFAVLLSYTLIVGPCIFAVAAIFLHQWRMLLLTLFPILAMAGIQNEINRRWQISRLYFFSFPLATAVYGVIMLHSAASYYFRGGNLWKGRRYRKTMDDQRWPTKKSKSSTVHRPSST